MNVHMGNLGKGQVPPLLSLLIALVAEVWGFMLYHGV